MSTREQRAQRRRDTWSAEVVDAGQAKPPVYADLTPLERLTALTALNARAWAATGQPQPPPLPRSEWPGELFIITSHD